MKAGRKPLAMLFRPVPYGKLFKAVAEGMEQGWADLRGLEAAYGVPLGDVWKPVLDQWERAGLVERAGAEVGADAGRAVLAGESFATLA